MSHDFALPVLVIIIILIAIWFCIFLATRTDNNKNSRREGRRVATDGTIIEWNGACVWIFKPDGSVQFWDGEEWLQW